MENENKTKELIEKTFLVLLAEQNLSEISVQDITKKCGINRNTFYYHYKNIPDLLESVVRKMVDMVLAEHPPRYATLEECFGAAMKLAKDNETMVYHIYNSSNRVIFERHLWHVIDYTVSSFVESFEERDFTMTEEQAQILADFFKYECFGFAIDWINKGMPDDAINKMRVLINFMLAQPQKV